MRISDWSSDVCSSDLHPAAASGLAGSEGPVCGMRADDGQELPPRLRIVAEGAQHAAGDHRHAVLADAARGHALVLAFDHDRGTLRLHDLVNRVVDLRFLLLLDLQPPGIGVSDTVKPADAERK